VRGYQYQNHEPLPWLCSMHPQIIPSLLLLLLQ
jgi:hypothetical protein